jgi:hypothetical protein
MTGNGRRRHVHALPGTGRSARPATARGPQNTGYGRGDFDTVTTAIDTAGRNARPETPPPAARARGASIVTAPPGTSPARRGARLRTSDEQGRAGSRLAWAALLACLALPLVSGCASTMVAFDADAIDDDPGERTFYQRLADESIETKAIVNLHAADERYDQAHLVVQSYNGYVLIAGQVPSEDLRQLANGGRPRRSATCAASTTNSKSPPRAPP